MTGISRGLERALNDVAASSAGGSPFLLAYGHFLCQRPLKHGEQGDRREMSMDLEGFFDGFEASRPVFDRLQGAMETLPTTSHSVTKSQIAFRHRKAFASAWIPGRVLRGKYAPLVLTISLRYRDLSPRWKEVVEPAPGRFTHHLELHSAEDIDAEVLDWLREAWAEAA
jgi:hypothetical protein